MGRVNRVGLEPQKIFRRFGISLRADSALRIRMRRHVVALSLLPAAAAACGCKTAVPDKPLGPAIEIAAPLGLPPVPIPADNPPTANAVALGRRLFYDKRLSQDNSLACANCHRLEMAFTDGRKLSTGVGGKTGLRNAPTILNSAYVPLLFWDGRASSLETQAASPIADPLEMNQTHDVSVGQLASDPAYRLMLKNTFGTEAITLGRVEKALASFERTLLSGDSAFDRYQYAGQKDALTAAQIRGLALFRDPHCGNCTACHTIDAKSALFTDNKFHNLGEGLDDNGTFTDPGRYRETHVDADMGAFKTPTLRNVALTAPYMHDGHLKTLKDVVDFYAGGGNSNPHLDKEIKSIHLTGQDRSDLVQFLYALTGSMPAHSGPPDKETTQ
jgi:cytochrome c peroxidase